MKLYLWAIMMTMFCVLLGCMATMNTPTTLPDTMYEICTQSKITTLICDCNGQEILPVNMSTRTEFKKLRVRDCLHLSVTGIGHFDEILIENSNIKIDEDERILKKQKIYLRNASIDNIPCGIDRLEAKNASIESLECSKPPKLTILINSSLSEMALDLRDHGATAITIRNTDIKNLSWITFNDKTMIRIHNSSAFCSAQARKELASQHKGFCKDSNKDEPQTTIRQHTEFPQEYSTEELNQIMGLFVEPNASSKVQSVIPNAILIGFVTLYLTKT